MFSCFYPLWPARPHNFSPRCQYAPSLLLKILFSKKLMINYIFFLSIFFFSNSGHLGKLEFLFLKNKNIKLKILHDSICLLNWLKESNLKELILFFTLDKISAVPSPATRYHLCPPEWGREGLPFLSGLSVWTLLFLFPLHGHPILSTVLLFDSQSPTSSLCWPGRSFCPRLSPDPLTEVCSNLLPVSLDHIQFNKCWFCATMCKPVMLAMFPF